MATPDDLKDTSAPDNTDNNYYLVTVDDLTPNKEYRFQFAWIYPDGRKRKDSDWSITKTVTTSNEAQPNPPQFLSGDLSADLEKIFVQWNGVDNAGLVYKGVDRVEVFISGGQFNANVPVTSFKVAGKKSIAAPAGTYAVTLKAVTALGTYSEPSVSRNVTIEAIAAEVIEPPTNPNGFSLTRILGGVELSWAGTYANGTFSGFKAIQVYAGNSAVATAGTYISSGVLTGDKVINKIVIPVDGTYCRYNQPIYIHARAINKNDEAGTLQQNVASDLLGAKTAVGSDLADDIITNGKIVDGAISELKIALGAITDTRIALGAITETKISDGAISTPKLGALAITADKIAANAITTDKIDALAITAGKIDALAITADKIATNAITASKIKAGEINVSKLEAGTISTNNLEAGIITSTSYLRAGTAGSGRVEISSSTLGSVLPGIHIYDTANNTVLSADLVGNISITGGFKSSTGTSYITVGAVSGDSSSGSGKLTFKVDGVTYPGYITFDSILGSSYGSLTIAPPSPHNTSSDVPWIDMVANPTYGGSVYVYSPGLIDLDGTMINLGGGSAQVSVQSVSWVNDAGTTNNPTIRVVAASAGGTLTRTFGVITSGAYGTSAPPSTLGSNGDFLFSS